MDQLPQQMLALLLLSHQKIPPTDASYSYTNHSRIQSALLSPLKHWENMSWWPNSPRSKLENHFCAASRNSSKLQCWKTHTHSDFKNNPAFLLLPCVEQFLSVHSSSLISCCTYRKAPKSLQKTQQCVLLPFEWSCDWSCSDVMQTVPKIPFFLLCFGEAPRTSEVFDFWWFAPARYSTGIVFPKYVYSSLSSEMVLNSIHIWSVDLFFVKGKVPGRNLIRMQHGHRSKVLLSGAVDFKQNGVRCKSREFVWAIFFNLHTGCRNRTWFGAQTRLTSSRCNVAHWHVSIGHESNPMKPSATQWPISFQFVLHKNAFDSSLSDFLSFEKLGKCLKVDFQKLCVNYAQKVFTLKIEHHQHIPGCNIPFWIFFQITEANQDEKNTNYFINRTVPCEKNKHKWPLPFLPWEIHVRIMTKMVLFKWPFQQR